MIAGKPELEKLSNDLVGLMKKAKSLKNEGLFNNAAQSYNHAFYWECMKPDGGGAPESSSNLSKAINKNFGSFEKFKEAFANAGNTQFGSGWAWLVLGKDGSLTVIKTLNAQNPILDGYEPLLTMDVWEHAYYLDYQNKRNAYVDIFMDKLVNWAYVEEKYDFLSGRNKEKLANARVYSGIYG